MSINLNDKAILNLLSVDYRCNVNAIYKSGALNFLKNAYLSEKKRNIVKTKEDVITYIMDQKKVWRY